MSTAKPTQAERRRARQEPTAGRAAKVENTAPAEASDASPPLAQRTWFLGLSGSVLLWAAFPPLAAWPLAWLAPVPWLVLVGREKLGGRRPYPTIWLAGCIFWLGVLHWLRLPHPATSLGWIALSLYLAAYLPLFIGLARVAVHRLHWPLVVAAPVVWTGLELFQARFLTGFNMAALGNSQAHWTALIQIADLAGNYAVGFAVMFGAACLARMLPAGGRRFALWPLAPLGAMLAAVLGYGYLRLDHAAGRPGPAIALIQGSIDTELKHDPKRQWETQQQYTELSLEAKRRRRDLDLIVWPETMYRNTLYTCSSDVAPPPEWTGTAEEFKAEVAKNCASICDDARWLGVPVLLGIDVAHYGRGAVARYNSAQFIDRNGEIGPRYDKMHPVMFGEYVPFAKQIPWLYRLTPLGGGLEAGAATPAIPIAGARLAANICYESCLPHLIRNQVAAMRAAGEEPDVLVNLTNDGWFWGSSELDLHLMCGVLRAVECRKPFLIAANTGISASIDADGRILEQGPRRNTAVLIADVRLDGRTSPYVLWGDWPAGLCLACCVGLAAVGLRKKVPAGEPQA